MFVRSRVVVPRKRKKGKYRLFATSALVMSAALAGKPAAASPPPQVPAVRSAEAVSFAIPAGQLDVVLKEFQARAGVTLDLQIPADTVAMMYSPGVSGTFSIEEALSHVLQGTSLTFRRSGSHVTIEVAASYRVGRGRPAASTTSRHPS